MIHSFKKFLCTKHRVEHIAHLGVCSNLIFWDAVFAAPKNAFQHISYLLIGGNLIIRHIFFFLAKHILQHIPDLAVRRDVAATAGKDLVKRIYQALLVPGLQLLQVPDGVEQLLVGIW